MHGWHPTLHPTTLDTSTEGSASVGGCPTGTHCILINISQNKKTYNGSPADP